MTSFQADVSIEYIYEAAIQKKNSRKSSQKNKYVALIRDDFDHVQLRFDSIRHVIFLIPQNI
jgi:hypothetical protein